MLSTGAIAHNSQNPQNRLFTFIFTMSKNHIHNLSKCPPLLKKDSFLFIRVMSLCLMLKDAREGPGPLEPAVRDGCQLLCGS